MVWISRERFAAALEPDGKLHAAPDLVVEVLSPGSTNERRDRQAKLKLYSRRGVRERSLREQFNGLVVQDMEMIAVDPRHAAMPVAHVFA